MRWKVFFFFLGKGNGKMKKSERSSRVWGDFFYKELFTLSPISMVQWKITLTFSKKNDTLLEIFSRFPHKKPMDYGRKGKHWKLFFFGERGRGLVICPGAYRVTTVHLKVSSRT